MTAQPDTFDLLFIHVPKFSSYYKPLDQFMFINYIPMGVFALCDILNKNNISAKIKHLGLEFIKDQDFSIVDYLQNNRIKTVALSLHWHYQAYDVMEIARKIKKASQETRIILGGITASLFADEIMSNYHYIDFLIAGDGEKGLLELTRALKEGSNDFPFIPNLLYRKAGKIINNGITYLADDTQMENVDYANLSYLDHYQEYRDYFKLPPSWSLYSSVAENLARKLSGATTTFPLMVGRGCSVNCSFCGGSRDAQVKICRREKPVFRPVKKVVDTMEQALSYGYESFIISFDPYPNDSPMDGRMLMDECMPTNERDYYIELFQEIRNRKISCGMGFESWGLPSKRLIAEFDKTFVKNLSYIALSPETFSERVRKLNKGFFYTNAELYHVMQDIADAEIPLLIYLTIGLPGETSRDIKDNVRFTKYIRKRFKNLLSINMVPIQLEPGSPLFENPEKYKTITVRKRFQDFYEYHQKPGSNPYSYVGYATQALEEAGCNIEKFQNFIRKERCKNFCIIQTKLFGKFYIPAFSRLICALSHKRWRRSGYGKPPQERITFH